MPVIPEPDRSILSETTLFIPTHAVMLFPRDEKRRKHWQAAAMAREYCARKQAGAPEHALKGFHAYIPDLWEIPLSPERTYNDGWAKSERALLSGVVLYYLLRLARYHPRHCKLERVKVLLVEFPTTVVQSPSASLVEKSWAEFQNVSHFWASLLLHKTDGEKLAVLRWVDFLKRADSFRRAAENARLLNPSETWTHGMEAVFFDPEPELSPLDRAKVEFLDDAFPD